MKLKFAGFIDLFDLDFDSFYRNKQTKKKTDIGGQGESNPVRTSLILPIEPSRPRRKDMNI